MPRQARQKSESGFYHVVNRGIGKQILFEDDEDYERFLGIVKRYIEEEHFRVLAYCLMDNHIHFLILAENNLDLIMKKISVSYAHYYNSKYERVGHLFQDRFKSEAIEEDRHLLEVCRYIHNNPQSAAICSRADYRWSSYREYKDGSVLADTDIILNMVGGAGGFEEFSLANEESDWLDISDKRSIGDTKAKEIIKNVLGAQSGTTIQGMPKDSRDDSLRLLKNAGLSVRQIERLTGINRGVIQKA